MGKGELIEGLKRKDEAAFLEIVNKYKKKIISLCYSFTENFEEAEDLSQEVFLNIYNKIQNFREECTLSTYIYKITISRCLDFKRKKKIKIYLSGLLTLQKNDTCDLDERQYIKQCIKSLPNDLRIVVILFYNIGLSQKEIANILEVTEKTVEGRIYRAKKKLKIEFEKEGYYLCNRNGIT